MMMMQTMMVMMYKTKCHKFVTRTHFMKYDDDENDDDGAEV